MAKKNNKRNKLDTWLPICSMGGTILGSIVSIAFENVLYVIVGSCIGLVLGIILGFDDITFKETKTINKKETKSKKETKTKKQTKIKKK